LGEDGDSVVALEAFAILKRFLPSGTRLTSTYRSPEHQLRIILDLAATNNIPVQGPVILNQPQTWAPILAKVRRFNKVNAPRSGSRFPISPHTKCKPVFDMSGPNLEAIVNGCRLAQRNGAMKFAQLLVEPTNHAVHVEVSWINLHELRKLYEIQGFAIV
jgi:hypothetical protein